MTSFHYIYNILLLIVVQLLKCNSSIYSYRILSCAIVNSNSNNNTIDCSDGVCKLPDDKSIKSKILSLEKELDTSNTSLINEMNKLGFNSNDSSRALLSTNNNIEEAINLLTKEEEDNELLNQLTNELYNKYYWEKDVSIYALKESNLNITLANQLLEQNEKDIQDQFNESIKELVNNGWDEFIARQALLAQWTLDQRKAQGKNDTFDRQLVESIRPTLHRNNETTTNTKSNKKINDKKSTKKQSQVKRANKEDCIFEINSSNFQKLVLDNKVPVILDLYADWCGPCKQLGPILEEAAMKSGGMFHLAKVNVDLNRDIVDTLGVTGFPTVFAFNKGKVSDRFVGLLPNDELQQFLVRSITGYGEHVQTELSDSDYNDLTVKINYFAGLASITFKKKEKLFSLLSDALSDSSAWDNEKPNKLNNNIKTALIYITNALNDIRNNKYRLIKTNNKYYQSNIGDNQVAVKILDIAGFKPSTNDSNALELSHYNSAILTLIVQKVKDIEKQRKFQIKSTNINTYQPSSYPTNRPTTYPTSEPTNQFISIKVVVNVNTNQLSDHFEISSSIANVISTLISDISVNDTNIIEISTNNIKKHLRYKSIKNLTLEDISNNSNEIIFTIHDANTYNKLPGNRLKSKKRTVIKDELDLSDDKTHNEYFGGDSTVVQGGEEDSDSDESSYILNISEDDINEEIENEKIDEN